jgi:hypothetical protein
LAPDWLPTDIDTARQHPARIYDYLLGGKNNFAVDREAAERALGVVPEIRAMAVENRAFLGRAVRYLTGAGFTQFLDLGTGIPSPGNSGEVARAIRPDARVVYADNDPLVAVHSRALLAGAEPDRTAVVVADVRSPKELLEDPAVRRVLDFGRPVAVLMVALLHFVPDEDDPAGVVARFMEAVPPGSALAVSHGTNGGRPDLSQESAKAWDSGVSRVTARSPEAIAAMLDGLDLVEPGVVRIPLWRPDGPVREDLESIWLWGGIGFKR